MAFFREADVRARARRRAGAEGVSVDEALRRASSQRHSRYDVFLSQTSRDAEIVLGVYDVLTNLGLAVFCDWIDAPEADRNKVTPANAAFIRAVMGVSDTLLFLDTAGAAQSFWMCWELGWFDGGRGLVAVFPILAEGERYYRGREFLGLYPYVELDEECGLKVVRPVVADSNGIVILEAPNSRSFDSWRSNPRDFMRPRVIGGFGH